MLIQLFFSPHVGHILSCIDYTAVFTCHSAGCVPGFRSAGALVLPGRLFSMAESNPDM